MNRQKVLKPSKRMVSAVESYRRQYFERYGRWPKKPDNMETMAQAGKYIGDIREALEMDRHGEKKQPPEDFFKTVRNASEEILKNTKRHELRRRIFVGLQNGLTEFKCVDCKNAKDVKTSVQEIVFFHAIRPSGSFTTCDYAFSITLEEALVGLSDYLCREIEGSQGKAKTDLTHLMGRVDSELSNVRREPGKKRKHNLNKRLFVGIGAEVDAELIWSELTHESRLNTERVLFQSRVTKTKTFATCDYGAATTPAEVLLIMKDYLRKLHVLRQAYIPHAPLDNDLACFYLRNMISKVTDAYHEMKDHMEREAAAPTLEEKGMDVGDAGVLKKVLDMLGQCPPKGGRTALGRMDEVFQRKCKGKAAKILFGGAPGGGKTNAVMQMAHADYGKLENEFFMRIAKKFLNDFEVSLPVEGLPYTAYPRVYDPKQIAKWFKENLG